VTRGIYKFFNRNLYVSLPEITETYGALAFDGSIPVLSQKYAFPKLQISMLEATRYSMYVSSNIKVRSFNQISDVNIKIPYSLRRFRKTVKSNY